MLVIGSDKNPARLNMELFRALQLQETEVFTPKIVYDGRKIAFSSHELPLGDEGRRQFDVSIPRPAGSSSDGSTRPPKVHHIILKLVAKLNPKLLQEYVKGEQSTTENILSTITAFNVVIRMEPNQNHPFNKRAFFTSADRRAIGGGIELWRGIFQSVRPTIGQLVVNIDITTGAMYKEGPLIPLCIELLGRPLTTPPALLLSPVDANGRRKPNYAKDVLSRLKKYLVGLRVLVRTTGSKPRTIRGLSEEGANTLSFQMREGGTMTVSQYFHSVGLPLQCPTIICVQIGAKAMIPLEMCNVLPGQIFRHQIPDVKMRDVLAFSTLKPTDKLARIKAGLQDMQHGQSNYVNQFGLKIDTEPLKIDARILDPPKLRYGSEGAQPIVVPRDGAWNMLSKRFYRPARIARWMMVIYDSRFNNAACVEATQGFLAVCEKFGVEVENKSPLKKYENGQGNIDKQLSAACTESVQKQGGLPTLMMVILPEGGGNIYTAVKHFGDVTMGIPTQCLRSLKCGRAREQYWANVLLKVNVKLGGINVIPDPAAVRALTDPVNPTIVIGADVIHPPPGAFDRPSFTAVVGSVDSDSAKYVATSRVQTGGREMIHDLKDMCKDVLMSYMDYREKTEKQRADELAPKRLIFYRDGVSEGEFKEVLDQELPRIKGACEELGIAPKITLIIVGKRHHNQLFGPNDLVDKSGNCPAGTVIDTGIAHPTDFDFFLQSHAGILGTSRPCHYSVLYDEYGFNADSIQALSFALCHCFARATRSVSLPAPVYYADIVCSRARNHFDPRGNLGPSDTSTQASGAGGDSGDLEAYKAGYKPLHPNQHGLMYFA
ncbi:hypothetical protein GALMADRAFT_266956 [Galerina marginata CBS 339.88]|uniref:Uncharacterized protein n=1 Tax=Galerina marginata (strain CBS 339.88) TaxID=685588 RepID=A0A067T300_GALM3|nr:hypothetical protein GALMADRAFT_266956 [Galerina marginata CBS 339.88]